jgi:O-antigen ligase
MIFFYILVFSAPMPNQPLFEATIAGLTVFKWLGIACCGYALFVLGRNRRLPSFLSTWEARGFLVLFGLATASYLTLSNPDGLTFSPMSSFASFLLFFFITIVLVDSYERLRKTLLAAIAGACVTSLYVIREFQASGGTNLRPGSVAGDSNYFATCTLLVLPMAFYFIKIKSGRLQKAFCAISLLLMLVAFTLASSRGGLVGLCVIIAYMIVRSGQSRRGAILIAVLIMPLLLFSPASPLTRMLHPDYGDNLGAQVRRDFWNLGLGMIQRHPLTGIGLGNFTAQSFSTSPGAEEKHGMACNTFLELAAELGVPGLLAYCVLLLGSLSSAGKLRKLGKERGDAFMHYTGQAMQAGLLGFGAAAVFVSAQYQKPFWMMVALTATFPLLRSQSIFSQSKRLSKFPAQMAVSERAVVMTHAPQIGSASAL